MLILEPHFGVILNFEAGPAVFGNSEKFGVLLFVWATCTNKYYEIFVYILQVLGVQYLL